MVLRLVFLPLVSVDVSTAGRCINTQCPERSLCSPASLCALKKVKLLFFPSECFRKIKWTNAKITGNSCYHNISSLCPGSVLQQRARLLQSLSNLDFPPWKFKYETQGGISCQCATSLPLHGVKSPSLASNSLCPSSRSWEQCSQQISLCPNKLFNCFCLQFSSSLLPCGNIAHFVKQDDLRLHWQLLTSLVKPIALFLTNFSAQHPAKPTPMGEETGVPHCL